MKKTTRAKLVLSTETLHRLTDLAQVSGGFASSSSLLTNPTYTKPDTWSADPGGSCGVSCAKLLGEPAEREGGAVELGRDVVPRRVGELAADAVEQRGQVLEQRRCGAGDRSGLERPVPVIAEEAVRGRGHQAVGCRHRVSSGCVGDHRRELPGEQVVCVTACISSGSAGFSQSMGRNLVEVT